MGKGEIAGYKQFLLFTQCFQKSFTADTEKTGLVWERVNVSYLTKDEGTGRGGSLKVAIK